MMYVGFSQLTKIRTHTLSKVSTSHLFNPGTDDEEDTTQQITSATSALELDNMSMDEDVIGDEELSAHPIPHVPSESSSGSEYDPSASEQDMVCSPTQSL